MQQDKKNRKASKKRININGFTLLEILIAMFILGILLSTLFASYAGTFRNIEETEYQADIYQMARITLERITEDLESAYISKLPEDSEEDTILQTNFIGEDLAIDGRNADTIRFTSGVHIVFNEDPGESGRARINYFVKESDKENTFNLYRSDTPEFEQEPEEEESGLVLCNDLNSIDFTYHDDDGEAHSSWDSTDELFKGRLPVMVSIQIEFTNRRDTESPIRFMTAVALPLAGDKNGESSKE
ncbi:MAG: type II secretion system protein [Deltaproteobacteria bacterium]|nr:type II secretion system protein [Deltaproteobacteria bacterium]